MWFLFSFLFYGAYFTGWSEVLDDHRTTSQKGAESIKRFAWISEEVKEETRRAKSTHDELPSLAGFGGRLLSDIAGPKCRRNAVTGSSTATSAATAAACSFG